MTLREGVLEASLERLERAARVVRNAAGTYSSGELVLPYGSSTGWEAAVFDHFQSVVKTICQKLTIDQAPSLADVVGGSTYTFIVWDGHPLNDVVMRGLSDYRQRADELRARVDEYNKAHGIPPRHRKVVAYKGQCVIEEEQDS